MNPALQTGTAWRADLERRLNAHRARQAERCPGLRPVTLPPAGTPQRPAPVIAPVILPNAESVEEPVPAYPARPPAEAVAEPMAQPRRRTPLAAAPEMWSGITVTPPAPFDAGPTIRPVPSAAFELAEPVRVAPRRHSAPPLPRTLDPDAVLRISLPLAAPHVAATGQVPARVKPAPRQLRLAAGMFDTMAVGLASLFFGLAAWAVAGFAAPDAHSLRHLLPALAAVPLPLAGLYRFLCAAGGGASLGMQRHGLELAGFDGPATPHGCRRRALFGFLSLAALGAGYLWMFLDGDHLTWHDHISRTYPRQR